MSLTIAILALCLRPAAADVMRLQNDVVMKGVISETTDEGLSLQVGADSTVFIPKASIVTVERQSAAQNKSLQSGWAKESSRAAADAIPAPAHSPGMLTLYQGEWLNDEELSRRIAFDHADLGTGRLDQALVDSICRRGGTRVVVSESSDAAWADRPERVKAHARHWEQYSYHWRQTPMIRYNTAPTIPYNSTAEIPRNDRRSIPFNASSTNPYDTRAAIPYNTRAAIPYNTRAAIPYNTLPLMRRNTAPAIPYGPAPSRHRRTKHGTGRGRID